MNALKYAEVDSNSFTTQGQDILPQPLLTLLSLLLEDGTKQSISTTIEHLNSNWQTLMYIDIYSVTHMVHSLVGSKSHTVRVIQTIYEH